MSSHKECEYHPVEVEEAVVAQVVAEELPAPAAAKATALPMIEVIAPANLPEGYTFEAEVGGRVITVTVVSQLLKFFVVLRLMVSVLFW